MSGRRTRPDASVLRASELFDGYPRRQLAPLAPHVDRLAVLPGAGLARAGRRPHEVVVLLAGEAVDAYLDRDDHVRGYALAFFRGRHVVEPTELANDEAQQFWRELLLVARAIEAEYSPVKLNLMFLGNAMPHLHAHLIPRYRDDPDAGGPPRFMAHRTDRRRVDDAEYLRQGDALRRRPGRR